MYIVYIMYIMYTVYMGDMRHVVVTITELELKDDLVLYSINQRGTVVVRYIPKKFLEDFPRTGLGYEYERLAAGWRKVYEKEGDRKDEPRNIRG